jgi:gliding motility-associated-like protein
VNVKGCDSFLYLYLTVSDTTNLFLFDTTCKNQPKSFNGVQLNVAGIYRDTLLNANGCDSFIYYNLFVKDTTKYDSFLTICIYNPIIFNGISRNINGIYKDTLVNVSNCDSFIYLHLTVNDTSRKDSFLTICKNYPITFNGQTLNTSGVYRDTFVNANGCDSFLVLNLTVNDTTKKDSFLTICKNYPIVFNGISRNTSGTYKDTLVNVKGCDSFVYLDLIVNDVSSIILFDTTCKNYPKLFNGSLINIPGLYRDTLINAKGCDSFIFYSLFVKDTTKFDSFYSICKNQSIIFNGITCNTTGIYKDTFVNAKGCDSFLYLHLNVRDTTKKDSFLTICKNYPITFNGVSLNTGGTYKDTLVNVKGCDSFVYLYLTVNDTTKKDSFLTTCKNYPITFNGVSLNTSGTYKDTLVNVKGCDSFIYLHLTVNDVSTAVLVDTTCKNYPKLFNGSLINIPGLYRDTLVNSKGCDSFIFYSLFVKDTSKFDSFYSICKNQSIIFNGLTLNNSGVYRDTLINTKGCDSFLYLHLNVRDTSKKDSFKTICKGSSIIFNGLVLNTTGIYRDTFINSRGCDSFLYLHLIVTDTAHKDSFLSICINSQILFNGKIINKAGIYKDTFSAGGCDSFIYLYLSIRDTTVKKIFDTTCKNYPKSFNGSLINVTGIYKDTLVNSAGCDSFIYYHLFVKDTTYYDSFLTICKNFPIKFNGMFRNNSGLFKDTLVNSVGCDSFLYLYLEVLSPYIISRDTHLCYSYSYRGKTYQANAIIYDTLKGRINCDSIYYATNLIIHNPYSKEDDSAKGCTKVEYRGQLYKKDTSFAINQKKLIFPYCDSINQKAVIKIYPYPKAKITISPDTLVREGQMIDIQASGGYSYRWAHTNSTSSLLEYKITETIVFTVTVTGDNQCESTVSQIVNLIPIIEVPKVFSPNNDGNNDILTIFTEGNLTILGTKIFNRWGQVVFESNDPNPKWDGIFKGDNQPQGSYVIQIEYIHNGKKAIYTGATTLIR